jgi:hypothetical protein
MKANMELGTIVIWALAGLYLGLAATQKQEWRADGIADH